MIYFAKTIDKFIFGGYYYHNSDEKYQCWIKIKQSECRLSMIESIEPKEQRMYPLITRDPVSGGELIVTRLECPESGVVIEGRFSLGWIGRLSKEQLEFVEMLVKYRGNIQRLAAEMNVAYNTARSRLDEIVMALGGAPENDGRVDRRAILERLAAKEISVEDATRMLKG